VLGLWVFPSTQSESPVCLDSSQALEHLSRTGIRRLSHGAYETACGKGYWACDSTETDTLRLQSDGLAVFLEESAQSCWWWDSRNQRWRIIWLSD
jgi:hypothetical protein